MIWVMALALWSTLAAGIYLLLSRDMMRCLFGLMLLGSSINLLIFMSGRVGSALPPIIEASSQSLTGQEANSVPQALVLTAIVIGFTLTCFSMLLAVALLRNGASIDIDAIRSAEPPETDPVAPPYASDAAVPDITTAVQATDCACQKTRAVTNSAPLISQG